MPCRLPAGTGSTGQGNLRTVTNLSRLRQGGHNAGHSIVANGISYDFHLLPSGLMNPECLNLIGSGVVVHVPTFFSELETIEKKGLKNVHNRIFISDRCHIDFDLHCAVDEAEEIELGSNSIGTTKRGIGPCYASAATRSGITMSEMFRPELFETRLRKLAEGYKKRFGDALKYDVEEEIERFKGYRERLAHYVVDAVTFVNDAQDRDARVLIEGSQALMLDVNYGTCMSDLRPRLQRWLCGTNTSFRVKMLPKNPYWNADSFATIQIPSSRRRTRDWAVS